MVKSDTSDIGGLRFQKPDPRIHPSAKLKNCRLGAYAEIGERVILRNVSVGDFSYFERNSEAIYSDIGRFCSIAAHVRINALEHPLERLSTHKFTYRPNEYFRFLPLDKAFRQRRMNKKVTIGHDVWIAHGAVILPDITIGHGAVIAANAVVSRNVEPYQIVAGVPAQPIKKRFKDDVVAALLELGWWDWPKEQIYEAVSDMQILTIEQFLEKWR